MTPTDEPQDEGFESTMSQNSRPQPDSSGELDDAPRLSADPDPDPDKDPAPDAPAGLGTPEEDPDPPAGASG